MIRAYSPLLTACVMEIIFKALAEDADDEAAGAAGRDDTAEDDLGAGADERADFAAAAAAMVDEAEFSDEMEEDRSAGWDDAEEDDGAVEDDGALDMAAAVAEETFNGDSGSEGDGEEEEPIATKRTEKMNQMPKTEVSATFAPLGQSLLNLSIRMRPAGKKTMRRTTIHRVR